MRILITLIVALLFPAFPASSEEARPPVTILISIDGFRSDYLDRGVTPNLNALAAKGATGPMRPSFPTKTFPNHYTLVTGLRPDRNGMSGNTMIDPRRPGQLFSMGDPRQALDPFWWSEAEPIWITAEKAGIRTATMFWPGSEVAFGARRPSDWLRYDKNIDNRQRVRTVLDWMRRPTEFRPAFVTLYFDTVDTIGHQYSPESSEVSAAIEEIDARIGDLVNGLAELGQPVNFVIVADHGMRETNDVRVIQLKDFIDLDSIIPVEVGPYAAIEPAAGTDKRVYDALLGKHDHMACYRKEDLPARLHYGSNPRVAAIICLAEQGWLILSEPPRYPGVGGSHGYDNADPEMLVLFIASGPSFASEVQLPVFDNVDVAPLLRKVLGLPQDPNLDGTLKPVEPAISEHIAPRDPVSQ